MWTSKKRTVSEIASTKDVTTAKADDNVKTACDKIVKSGRRRLPIIDNEKFVKGLLTSMDLINLFGGGVRYKIIKEEFGGNFLKAVNMEVSRIMTRNPFCMNGSEPIDSAAEKLLLRGIGGVPVVDGDRKLLGMVTEFDFIAPLAGDEFRIPVMNAMSKKVITLTPNTALGDAARVMTVNKIRRLPVITDSKVVGMLRGFDVLKFISKGEFSRFKTTDAEKILAEPVSSVMDKEVKSVPSDMDLGEVITLSQKTRKGGFPVIDEGKLVGIIT